MAKVLALVPSAGLDAVLVAVELALETGAASGRVSVEHVINVLARLNARAAAGQRRHAAAGADPADGRHRALRPAARHPEEADHDDDVSDRLVEFKALRLHGMAGAWADLIEQQQRRAGDLALARSSRCCRPRPPTGRRAR